MEVDLTSADPNKRTLHWFVDGVQVPKYITGLPATVQFAVWMFFLFFSFFFSCFLSWFLSLTLFDSLYILAYTFCPLFNPSILHPYPSQVDLWAKDASIEFISFAENCSPSATHVKDEVYIHWDYSDLGIIIRNLYPFTSVRQICDHFSAAGQVHDESHTFVDAAIEAPFSTGYVKMTTTELVDKAIHQLNGSLLNGQAIILEPAAARTIYTSLTQFHSSYLSPSTLKPRSHTITHTEGTLESCFIGPVITNVCDSFSHFFSLFLITCLVSDSSLLLFFLPRQSIECIFLLFFLSYLTTSSPSSLLVLSNLLQIIAL